VVPSTGSTVNVSHDPIAALLQGKMKPGAVSSLQNLPVLLLFNAILSAASLVTVKVSLVPRTGTSHLGTATEQRSRIANQPLGKLS
jgi:hypothetical protein